MEPAALSVLCCVHVRESVCASAAAGARGGEQPRSSSASHALLCAALHRLSCRPLSLSLSLSSCLLCPSIFAPAVLVRKAVCGDTVTCQCRVRVCACVEPQAARCSRSHFNFIFTL
eukprot:1459127-Rhodomonas_salina.1